MLITPFAFYHIVTNFSIGLLFGVQVTQSPNIPECIAADKMVGVEFDYRG